MRVITLETGKKIHLGADLFKLAVYTRALWTAGHYAITQEQATALEDLYFAAEEHYVAQKQEFFSSLSLTEEEQEELEGVLTDGFAAEIA